MEKNILQHENQIDDAESYERRDTLVISGSALPTGKEGESTINLCRSLLKEQLKLDIENCDTLQLPKLEHAQTGTSSNWTSQNWNIILKLEHFLEFIYFQFLL